ncbi:MAG: DUF2142 domain-containing protein, partial [Actinobacteria bacterium]|nr:DUF2142 domain-containing protein [Actinomycetota bacterium]
FGLTWLTAARVMGAFYLAIVALLVVGIARRLGASSLIAFAAAVVVTAMPMMLLQFSTINNDSLAVLLSLAAVYTFLRMKDSAPVTRSLVAFGFAFAAMTVKETALISVLAVVVLSMRDVVVGEHSRRWLRVTRVVVSAGVVVAAAGLLRMVVYPMLVGSLPDNGLQSASIVDSQGTPPFNLVAGNALRQASSVFEVPDGVLVGVWFSVAAQVVVLVALGLPLAAILRTTSIHEWASRRRLLGASVLLGIPVFILGFLLLLLVSGLPAFFQPRYLLPVIVLAVAVAAAYVKPPWWRLATPVALIFAVSVGVTLLASPHWAG